MADGRISVVFTSCIVALGGFLMGFDASVISGVVGLIESEFALSKLQLGWSVASLTLTATLAMLVAGPLSDRIGRRRTLQLAALLFALSAVASALARDYTMLVLARMLGGFGVGAALIIAPVYIAESAPPQSRGRLVSINQLNIVLGISAAFFSNYLIISWSALDAAWVDLLGLYRWSWRWMLGVELLPAIAYLMGLLFVPESPRWLAMRGRDAQALAVLTRLHGADEAARELDMIRDGLHGTRAPTANLAQLFRPALRLVLTIGISIGVLQQITGINSVFFYAPLIFEQSGVGTNAAFMQAVLVGLVNLVFTVIAMAVIDRLGRRPLLGCGLTGIAVFMFALSYGFGTATYRLPASALEEIPDPVARAQLAVQVDRTYASDVAFADAMASALGERVFKEHQSALVNRAISINAPLILIAILGFVASFAVSLGPVMWVLFSEIFPTEIRGLAISFVGLINSTVSFAVQFIFPWELDRLGAATTFLIYGLFAAAGLLLVLRILPETKGRSLEALEAELVGG